MNTGLLGDPSPSNGYDAVLAALQPHSAPGEGSLGGTAPSVHNRVKQTFINPVATYPFIARKWSQGWEQSFHCGDLMFVFTGRGASDDTFKVQTQRHTILANLPVLNHIMRLVKTDDHYSSFRNLKSWAFIGIMRNSSAASGLNPSQTSKRGGNAITPDRIINIDVRGATRMFNYWESARAGGHLWLAWRELKMSNASGHLDSSVMGHAPKKRQRDDLIGTTVNYRIPEQDPGTGRVLKTEGNDYTIQPTGTDGGENVTIPKGNVFFNEVETCWQLLPYSEGYSTDSQGEVISANYKPLKIWWSDQTLESRKFKRPLCVGWVFQGIGGGELSDSSSAIRKATQLAESRFQLPMIHAFLHV